MAGCGRSLPIPKCCLGTNDRACLASPPPLKGAPRRSGAVPVQIGFLTPEVSSAALPTRRMLRCGRKPLVSC